MRAASASIRMNTVGVTGMKVSTAPRLTRKASSAPQTRCKSSQCRALGSGQRPGRQNPEMGRKLREIGMQFPPEALDELSCRTLHIRDQCVTRLLHT